LPVIFPVVILDLMSEVIHIWGAVEPGVVPAPTPTEVHVGTEVAVVLACVVARASLQQTPVVCLTCGRGEVRACPTLELDGGGTTVLLGQLPETMSLFYLL
jgi:hypothetical protein